MEAVAAHSDGDGLVSETSQQYTKIALRRDANIPITGIPIPRALTPYTNGETVFFPKKRVTIVPALLAGYLRAQYGELFL